MPIEITKIIDEMVDIRTGEHFTHGVVISNGFRETFIPLRKESLQPLLELYAELVGVSEEQAPESTLKAAEVVPKAAQRTVGPGITFLPIETPEMEPGEDYSDDLTGTASI